MTFVIHAPTTSRATRTGRAPGTRHLKCFGQNFNQPFLGFLQISPATPMSVHVDNQIAGARNPGIQAIQQTEPLFFTQAPTLSQIPSERDPTGRLVYVLPTRSPGSTRLFIQFVSRNQERCTHPQIELGHPSDPLPTPKFAHYREIVHETAGVFRAHRLTANGVCSRLIQPRPAGGNLPPKSKDDRATQEKSCRLHYWKPGEPP